MIRRVKIIVATLATIMTLLVASAPAPTAIVRSKRRSDLRLWEGAQPARQRFNFDFGWKFVLGDPAQAERPNFDDSHWQPADVPHDWSIKGPWSPDSPSGKAGGFAPLGIGWYRKSLRLPQSLSGKRIFLDFDGVFNHSDVWVNGHKVGSNQNGYVGFECDITPWVRFDRDTLIAVRADNLKQASRWYTGSGIFRHVWLVATGAVHVAHWGTYVSTPSITRDRAQVRIETSLRNDSDDPRSVLLAVRVLDPAGKQVASQTSPIQVVARSEMTLTQQVAVAQPQLWSLQSPRLYRAETEVRANDQPLDVYETRFGIRTVQFDVHRGFLLNGERVVIKGVCIHHDLGSLGAATLESGFEHRLNALKAIGINAIRLSHDAKPPELLDLSDRVGLLIFDEAFDKWEGFFPDGTGWKSDLRSFILRDRNHPSIFIWSVGNEMTPHMYMREGTLLYQAMQNFVHELDPTRAVTAALHPVRNSQGERNAPLAEIANYMDVISMNYQTRFYARDHQQHPKQVLLGSETHLHQVNLNTPRPASDNSGNQWWGTRDYTTGEYFPYVAGQFIWAGVEYLGESEGWPSKGYRTTLLNMMDRRKPFSYFIQSLYADNPMVYIAVDNPHFSNEPRRDFGSNFISLLSHLNFPHDLAVLRVYTFTNAQTVELLLNGRSLGEKRSADFADRIILWDVPNEPGKLRAVAKREGRIIATHELQTAGKAVRLVLTPDRTTLDATGQDLAYVQVQALDEHGIVVPGQQSPVAFSIGGEGAIAGVDNADLDSPEMFKQDHRELRGGEALVIVQSARQAGTIHLRAHAEGLADGEIEIHVQQSAHPMASLP